MNEQKICVFEKLSMEIWVPITVLAAFMQNIRSATQKHLSQVVGTLGATFVRFGFGLPFACLFVGFMHYGLNWEFPNLNTTFWTWVIMGAASQIIAQILLIKAFALSNFTVATAYSRTEAAQAALISFILLSETINWQTSLAILITVFGVILISIAKASIGFAALLAAIKSKAAQLGLLAGSFFGISATTYRGASLSLEAGLSEPNFLMQAGTTLLATILLQSVVLFIWMLIHDRAEIVRVGKAWKWGLLAGFMGASASFGWFIGFTLQAAAVIKAVAQVEMLFTYASSVFIFKEKITKAELIGCALIVLGILGLVLS